MKEVELKKDYKVLLNKNITRLQACKYLIWFAFAMLIGMFCATHYVWFNTPLTLINIVFYIGMYCCIVSLLYILNENYKQLRRDIKFFENKLEDYETKIKAE